MKPLETCGYQTTCKIYNALINARSAKDTRHLVPSLILMATTRVMSIVLRAVLPQLRVNQNTAKTFLYRQVKYQGMSLLNLYLELCIEIMQNLLKHDRQDTQIGKSIMDCLKGHQLKLWSKT